MTGALGAAMAAEIAESPGVTAEQLEHAREWAPALPALLPTPLRGVALTARGSSDHAAAYGRYVLEQALRVPAWSTAPSLITRSGVRSDMTGVLAIAVSQSGRTPEIVTVLEHHRAAGAVTVAITNDAASPLAEAAHLTVPLAAGVETAVPATKTFTATLLAFALLAAAVDATGRFRVDAGALQAAIVEAVADDDAVAAPAAVLAGSEIALHLGRGVLLPVARETALKLIETTATAHLAWSTVDVLHGPVALAEAGHPVLVHHAPGTVSADAAAIVERLDGLGNAPWVVGEPLAGAAGVVPVPGAMPEHLRPLVHAIRLQQLALAVARGRGVDPDHPRGLNKVTATT